MASTHVPCKDCETMKEALEASGLYVVTGCSPAANGPDGAEMCRITWKKRTTSKLHALAMKKGGSARGDLAEHFTLQELTFSQTAARNNVDNTPTPAQIANLRSLCQMILEPLRMRLQKPIVVSSGFRSEALNRLVDGAPNSQHLKGMAADFVCPAIEVKRLFKAVIEMGLPFDQLIYEGGRQSQWVHVSYDRERQRGEILAATFPVAGGVQYRKLSRKEAMDL
jgi:zinc D-Ala-D-Ala carboxypeptidase